MTHHAPFATFEAIREAESELYWPVFARLPVCFEWGRGAHLYDLEGNEYLDFLTGIGVAILGHAHPAVTEAVRRQAELLVSCSNLFYSRPQLELLELLAARLPGGRWFLSNSGAEACEAAIKVARKFGRTKGRFRIVTALNSFHGRTLATLAATGQPSKQEAFAPLPDGFDHVPFNDLEALERAIRPDTVAVMLELVQGEGGVYPADAEYVRGVAAICRERGLLLVLDEVQTGLGRTGSFFAFERYGVVPDVVTLAKGLANGVPIGATWASERVASALERGDHGSTYGGNALACAAAAATLRTIEEEGLVARAAELGAYLAEALDAARQASGGAIAAVRAAGLMAAVDLAVPRAAELVERLLEKRVIAGKVRDATVRVLPPLVIEKEHVDRAVAALREAVAEVVA